MITKANLEQDIAHLIEQLSIDVTEAQGDRKKVTSLLHGYKKDLEQLEENYEKDLAFARENLIQNVSDLG